MHEGKNMGIMTTLKTYLQKAITLPVGFAFYQPAPELSAWYKRKRP